MKEKQEQFFEIDIWQLLKALWQRAWLIVLATVLGGVIAFCYARFYVTPTYSASVMMYMNSGSLSVGSTSINISTGNNNSQAMEAYMVVLKTRTTLQTVIEEANLSYTYEQLQSMVSASQVGETPIFKVTVTTNNPEEAATIANAVAEVLQYNVSRVISGCNAQLMESAVVPMSRTSPSYTRYIEIGLLIGLLLSGGTIAVITMLDDTFHSADYLIQRYDVPVLAQIPDLLSSKTSSDYHYYYYETSKQSGVGKKEA